MSRSNQNIGRSDGRREVNSSVVPISQMKSSTGKTRNTTMPTMVDNPSILDSRSASVSANSQMTETSVPNFLLKLWKLVEDPSYDFCIAWDESGTSFHVREPYVFSKDVLPLFFKHSNLNSFIRQLNMYGFRKVTSLEQGALKHQTTEMDSLEFHHQYFVRSRPELLQYIKRKTTAPRLGAGELVELHDREGSGNRTLGLVLDEVRQLREKQFTMDAKLHQVKKENETLWREIAHMRQMHLKQQQVVTKLIQFLLAAVQPAGGGRLGKRNLLAIGNVLSQQSGLDDSFAPSLSKRSRMNSDDAVNIIESLEQELRKQPKAGQNRLPSNVHEAGTSSGITIADITDESDALGVNLDAVPTTGYAISPESNPNEIGATDPIVDGLDTTLAQTVTSPPNSYVAPVPPNEALVQVQPTATATIGQPQEVSQIWNMNNQASNQINSSMLLSPVAADDNSDWSKPEFSQYLDYVQNDLDVLKEFLCSEGLDIDSNSLNDLFATSAEDTAVSTSLVANNHGGDIIGNEVQVYKPPEMLVNFASPVDQAGPSSIQSTPVQQSSSTISESGIGITTPSSGSYGLEHQIWNCQPPATLATPNVSNQQEILFDLLDDTVFTDPLVGMTPESLLRTPITPANNLSSSTVQQQQHLQQGNTSNGNGRPSVDNLLRSTLSKSKNDRR